MSVDRTDYNRENSAVFLRNGQNTKQVRPVSSLSEQAKVLLKVVGAAAGIVGILSFLFGFFSIVGVVVTAAVNKTLPHHSFLHLTGKQAVLTLVTSLGVMAGGVYLSYFILQKINNKLKNNDQQEKEKEMQRMA